MAEKFDIYDVLAVLVPGTMLLCAAALFFPEAAKEATIQGFPQAFSVIALTAAAMFLGQLVQALVSWAEPVLEWSWGGRLSERALSQGLGERYFPQECANRISARLTAALGVESATRSKFVFALQMAETSGNGRVGRFNALYAYHRALFFMVFISLLLLIMSSIWGHAGTWPITTRIGSIICGCLLAALLWHRTRQRGIYYVREVLYTTERLLTQKSDPK